MSAKPDIAIKKPDIDAEKLYIGIADLARKEISDTTLFALVKRIYSDIVSKPSILAAPAAKGMHHTYPGGLLEHTLSVANLCVAYADQYADLDRQVLIAGALLHDIGKVYEYKIQDNGPGLTIWRTDDGVMLGHIVMGLQVLQEGYGHLDIQGFDIDDGVRQHLMHLIASHHGKLEFGSPVEPKTKEAWALHFADHMDATMKNSGWSAC